MYEIRSSGKCIEQDIPSVYWSDILKQLTSQLPEGAQLLASGNITDSNLRMNLYGGVFEKDGYQGILSRNSSATLICMWN